MPHYVDGWGLRYTGRTTWRAEYWSKAGNYGEIPVAWENDLQMSSQGDLLAVRHRKKYRPEMDAHRTDRAPFIVAIARANNPKIRPGEHRDFKQFLGVFEVAATGRRLTGDRIETKILRRLTAGAGH
jgi:hypothetical protein